VSDRLLNDAARYRRRRTKDADIFPCVLRSDYYFMVLMVLLKIQKKN
jgi:hypothetical protein